MKNYTKEHTAYFIFISMRFIDVASIFSMNQMGDHGILQIKYDDMLKLMSWGKTIMKEKA